MLEGRDRYSWPERQVRNRQMRPARTLEAPDFGSWQAQAGQLRVRVESRNVVQVQS